MAWKGVHQTHDQFIELLLLETPPYPLNREFQLDLEWWKKFLNGWHRVSFWLFAGLTPCPDAEVFSGALGRVWGLLW